jgi:hypothetical protein
MPEIWIPIPRTYDSSYRSLSQQFGLGASTVRDIKKGITWKWVK